jgi:hypothetical protein
MKIYWSASSIPELAGLPREEARKAWRACYLKGYKHWQTWLGIFIALLCTFLGAAIGKEIILGGHNMHIIGSGIGCAVGGGMILSQIIVRQIRPYLRQYIDQHYRQ